MIFKKSPQEKIFREFIAHIEADEDMNIINFDESNGVFTITHTLGKTVAVSLANLIDYYIRSGDENAVKDFVIKVKEILLPEEDNTTWEEAKHCIYFSLFPNNSERRSPYAKDVTKYFNIFPVLDTPKMSAWVFPEMIEKWGVTEAEIEKQAIKNGAHLLEEVSIEIGDVNGHPLGSFRVQDRNLTAACLFASGLKEKVIKDFGWPIYVIFPNKINCFFFGKDHYDYFEENIPNLVVDRYNNPRYVTPELLEFSDEGIKSICSWSIQNGKIVKTDEE